MKFLGQDFQKLEPKHDTHTHTHTHTDATECITTPHLLVVIISEMQSSVKIWQYSVDKYTALNGANII